MANTLIAPLATPTSGLAGDTLARKWVLDVNIGYGTATPNWTRMYAITSLKPSEKPKTQDSTTYDSGGWASSTVTMMEWGYEIEVSRKQTADGLSYDTAVEYCRAKCALQTPGNIAEIRVYEFNGLDGPRKQAYSGLVSLAWQEGGGGADALSSATLTMAGQGKRLEIPHPIGETAWAATTAYVVGERVIVGANILQATVAGTSAAAAPTAPTTRGATVTDGSVTWKRVNS